MTEATVPKPTGWKDEIKTFSVASKEGPIKFVIGTDYGTHYRSDAKDGGYGWLKGGLDKLIASGHGSKSAALKAQPTVEAMMAKALAVEVPIAAQPKPPSQATTRSTPTAAVVVPQAAPPPPAAMTADDVAASINETNARLRRRGF